MHIIAAKLFGEGKTLGCLLAVSSVAVAAQCARAAEQYWVGGTAAGVMTESSNWDPVGTPTGNDLYFTNGVAALTVSPDSSTLTMRNLRFTRGVFNINGNLNLHSPALCWENSVAGDSVSVTKEGDWHCNYSLYLANDVEGTVAYFTNKTGNLYVDLESKFAWKNDTRAFFTMLDGTVTFNNELRLGDNGGECTFVKEGGTFVCNKGGDSIEIAYGGDSRAWFYHNGGTSRFAGNLAVTRDGSGEFYMNGGEVSVGGRAVFGSWFLGGGKYANLYLNGGVFEAQGFNYHNGNAAANVVFDGGTFKAAADGGLAVSDYLGNYGNYLKFTVKAGGGTIDVGGHSVTMSLPIEEDAASTGGGMTFTGGGMVEFAADNTYTGTTTLELGTAISVPSPVATNKLVITMPAAGLADGVYPIETITGGETFAEDYLDNVTKPVDARAQYVMSGDRKVIYCVYGDVENMWVGGTTGSLCDAENWMLHKVPGNGETAYIGCIAASTLTIPQGSTFSPSVMYLTGAALTIAGEGAITGISVISNLSSGVLEVACPLTFAGTYNVHCETHAVNFSGGATATYPDPDTTDNAASHTLMGDITFTSDWAQGKVAYPYTVPSGSVIHGEDARGTDATPTEGTNPYGDFLSIQQGGQAWFKTVYVDQSTSHINTDGELHVSGIMTVGDVNDNDGAHATHDQDDTGAIYAAGLRKCIHRRIYIKVPSIYIGKEGLGSTIGDYSIVFADHAKTLYATDDFSIFSPDDTKDWGVQIMQPLTINTQGHTVTWNASAEKVEYENGWNGTLTKDGDGTLVFNPKRVTLVKPVTVKAGILKITNAIGFNTCEVTVKDGAVLEVVSGSTSGTGDVSVEAGATLATTGTGTATVGTNLTFEASACIGFNFTTKSTSPVLDLTDTYVSFGGSVVVMPSTADGRRPFSGSYVLTSGGKFAGATVSLAEDAPDWAIGVSVVDGDIVMDVKPMGTTIILR